MCRSDQAWQALPDSSSRLAEPSANLRKVRLLAGSPMPSELFEFSDEEKDVLLSLAQPVAFGRRPEFLEKVAEELANCPHRGPGPCTRSPATSNGTLFSPRCEPPPSHGQA